MPVTVPLEEIPNTSNPPSVFLLAKAEIVFVVLPLL